MSKHTPGPWKAIPRDSARTGKAVGGYYICQYHTKNLHQTIAYLQSHPASTFEIDEANAQLISAAPEMLAALEHVKDCLRPFIENPEKGIVKGKPMDLSIICQAIAKAKGERKV